MIISSLQRSKLSEQIINKSVDLGLFACGISRAEHLPEDEEKTESWLENGFHGEMGWMERNKEKRYDPTKLVPGAKSVITVLYSYTPKEKITKPGSYHISAYAYGSDYHKVLKDKLYQLLTFIDSKTEKCNARVFVDSAPVLDRAWANKSGLGFIGKNTMLINRKGGSNFFIGHIILDIELDYNGQEADKNFCGSCTLCIKACPTNAIEPFKLDARKCISYLTIEHRSEIPEKFKDQFEDWIFGCDICQDICPWNRDAKPNNEPLFEPIEELGQFDKQAWQNLNEQQFDEIFKDSAIQRTGFKGLIRNINYLKD